MEKFLLYLIEEPVQYRGELKKKSIRKRLAGPAKDKVSFFCISMLDSFSYLETNRDSFQFFSILVIK